MHSKTQVGLHVKCVVDVIVTVIVVMVITLMVMVFSIHKHWNWYIKFSKIPIYKISQKSAEYMTKLIGVFLHLPVANAPNLDADVEIMICLKLSCRKN
jgi:hypothetical protein